MEHFTGLLGFSPTHVPRTWMAPSGESRAKSGLPGVATVGTVRVFFWAGTVTSHSRDLGAFWNRWCRKNVPILVKHLDREQNNLLKR